MEITGILEKEIKGKQVEVINTERVVYWVGVVSHVKYCDAGIDIYFDKSKPITRPYRSLDFASKIKPWDIINILDHQDEIEHFKNGLYYPRISNAVRPYSDFYQKVGSIILHQSKKYNYWFLNYHWRADIRHLQPAIVTKKGQFPKQAKVEIEKHGFSQY